MRANSLVVKKNSHSFLITSLTLGAVIAATRPAFPTKVYAATNTYEWTKHVDQDLRGGQYTSAAISADGNHLIVSTTDGGEGYGLSSPLFVSDNYGDSWENVSDSIDLNFRNNWSSVDISNNGQTMVAASSYSIDFNTYNYTDGKIFISEDGGDNWENISPGSATQWHKVAVSGDGSTVVAIADDEDGIVYITENGGDTWNTSQVNDIWEWESLSVSDDGNKIIVGGENTSASSSIYITENGGDNWENISPDEGNLVFTTTTSMSATGNKIVVSTYGYNNESYDKVFLSENNGNNWTEITPDDDGVNEWMASAVSDDGTTITVLDDNNKMYVSTNNGSDWTEEEPGYQDDDYNEWLAADLNSNGSKVVTLSDEYLYTGFNENVGSPDPESQPVYVDFNSAENGASIRLITPDGTTITCFSSVKESALAVQDAGYNYPVGLVDFCFDTDEESNEVSLIFVTDLKSNEVVARKYNPNTSLYDNVLGVSITETTLNGKNALRVTYIIVDNGPLDLDPDVGEIADPIGIASVLGSPNTGLSNVRNFLFIQRSE